MRKPNPDIFEFVLEQHKLIAEECLFIDDTAENTQAAAALGMHVWNLEPTREDVIDLFTTKKSYFDLSASKRSFIHDYFYCIQTLQKVRSKYFAGDRDQLFYCLYCRFFWIY